MILFSVFFFLFCFLTERKTEKSSCGERMHRSEIFYEICILFVYSLKGIFCLNRSVISRPEISYRLTIKNVIFLNRTRSLPFWKQFIRTGFGCLQISFFQLLFHRKWLLWLTFPALISIFRYVLRKSFQLITN